MEIIFHSHANKTHFTRKVVHLDSLWKWGFSQLRSGLFLKDNPRNWRFALKDVTFRVIVIFCIKICYISPPQCYILRRKKPSFFARDWEFTAARRVCTETFFTEMFSFVIRQIRQAQGAVYFLTSSPRPLTLEVYKTSADFFFRTCALNDFYFFK